jgi:hypothetical protein
MSMTLQPGVLAKYMSDIFIETGTYDGRGVKLALSCGFKKVITVELDPVRAKASRIALVGIPGVEFYEGDSSDILPKVLASLDKKATIFLDAHPVGGGDVCKFGRKKWPLTEELKMIAEHSKRKDHNILVDDRHDFGLFETSDDKVFELLRAINPKYNIRIEPNNYTPWDMITATVEG